MADGALTEVIFFISDRRVGMIRPDGSGERYPAFSAPNQVSWQLNDLFPDGRQAILWSQEPPRNPHAAFSDPDGPGFATTHLWRYDFVTQAMPEIALPAHAGLIGLLPGGDRFLVIENTDGITALYSTNLDGGDRDDYYSSPGYAYGAALSPDGSRVAFHLVGAPDLGSYTIRVLHLADRRCALLAGDWAWLYFAPTWSPDGQWLLYQRCAYREDPGHDRSDLCLSRGDGAEHHLLTTGQSHWFAAAMGTPERHSSGS
ncbi:MAG TPA: hypothetical protein PLZ36_18490, partial [Armatimonadota bacterium]|nr:hypothetical protein [Armatimonadota bacterium]